MSIPGLVMYHGYIRYCHWGNLGRIHRDLPWYFYSFLVNLKLLQNKKLNTPRECRPNFNQPPVFSLKCVDIPWPSPNRLMAAVPCSPSGIRTYRPDVRPTYSQLSCWLLDRTCSLETTPAIGLTHWILAREALSRPTNSYAFCTNNSYLMNREPDLQFSHSVVHYTGQINCIKNMSQNNDFTSS